VAGIEPQLPLFARVDVEREAKVALPLPSVGEDLVADYATSVPLSAPIH
jgi:error-prone DNA polymerase